MPSFSLKTFICGFSGSFRNLKAGCGQLCDAANDGNHKVVRHLLADLQLDPNCKNEYGSSPLLLAAVKGHFDAAEILIHYKADVNQDGPLGWTPLHAACFYGHVEVVNLLLEHGALTQKKSSACKCPGDEFDLSVPFDVCLRIRDALFPKCDIKASAEPTSMRKSEIAAWMVESMNGQNGLHATTSPDDIHDFLKKKMAEHEESGILRVLKRKKLEALPRPVYQASDATLDITENSERGSPRGWRSRQASSSYASSRGLLLRLTQLPSVAMIGAKMRQLSRITVTNPQAEKSLDMDRWSPPERHLGHQLRESILMWKQQPINLKKFFQKQLSEGMQNRLSVDQFEAACLQLPGTHAWMPLSLLDQASLLKMFDPECSGCLSFKILCQYIDHCKNESPGLGIEPMPDEFAERALVVLEMDHPIRSFCIRCAFHPAYQRFIIFIILLNSIVMALVDYSVVDSSGNPSPNGSKRNLVIEKTEPLFAAVFVAECIIRIGALGFVAAPYTYLRNGWNCFDFVVVVSSLITLTPYGKRLAVLKVFRVLRPLKALSRIEGLKLIINGLLESLTALGDVLLIFLLIMYLFTTVGLGTFMGSFHARCRLTPFPVLLDPNCTSYYEPCWADYLANVSSSPDLWRCLDAPNDDMSWGLSSSPWHTRQDCVWPTDPNEFPLRVCSLAGTGNNRCVQGQTCGSDYDYNGNPRFIDSPIPYGVSRMVFSSYFPDFCYGYATFDNFFAAFLSLFQALTLTDWVLMETMGADSVSQSTAACFFIFFCFVGSYIMLNLVLGVMTEGLMEEDQHEIADAQHERLERTSDISLVLGAELFSEDTIFQEETDEEQKAANPPVNEFEDTKRAVSVCNSLKIDEEPPTGCWTKFVQFVDSRYFSNFMMACIFINTIVLALDHYPEINGFVERLGTINNVLTVIFTVEMALVICAHGLFEYIRCLSSLFDGCIVLTSLAELVIDLTSSGGSSRVSALRTFRMFRLFKLARSSKNLQILLRKMLVTFMQMGNFGLLLALFIYIFALLGMEFFANNLHFDPTTGAPIKFGEPGYDTAMVPRQNFDTFVWAFSTVFGVLTFDNWDYPFQMCRAATGFVAVAYFVLLGVIGGFIIMNLFMAILLMNFSKDDGNESREGLSEIVCSSSPSLRAKLKAFIVLKLTAAKAKVFGSTVAAVIRSAFFIFEEKMEVVRKPLKVIVEDIRFQNIVLLGVLVSSLMLCVDNPLNDPNGSLSKSIKEANTFFGYFFALEAVVKIIGLHAFNYPGAYFRDPWNWIDFLVTFFGLLTLFNIGAKSTLSSIRIVRVVRPLRMINRIEGLKKVVLVLFKSIPTMLEITAISVLFLLIFSIFSVSFLKGSFNYCAYPPDLSNDQVQLLEYPQPWSNLNETQQGWFLNSTCPDASSFPQSPTSQDICNCWFENSWVEMNPYPINFNNVVSAFFTLYECATLSNWQSVMWSAVDQRGIGFQPIPNNNLAWVIFFLVYILVVGIFLINVFVGAIVDFFNRMKNSEKEKSLVFATAAQLKWVRITYLVKKMKANRKFPIPKNPLRLACYKFILSDKDSKGRVTRTAFLEPVSLLVICLNGIVMAMQFHGMPDFYQNVLKILNLFFTMFFNFEAIVKIMAFGRYYFNDSWNIFDAIIVFSADISLLLGYLTGNQIGSITSIGRVLRLFRIIQVSKAFSGVKHLLISLISSIPGFVNVAALLVLVYFIYAVLGVQLFSTIEGNSQITPMANFRSLSMALIMLFKISTGDNWNNFVHEVTTRAPGCVDVVTYNPNWCELNDFRPGCVPLNGCGTFYALPYFYSFYLVANIILMNLFVGVILDSMSTEKDTQNKYQELTPEVIADYGYLWDDIDPYKTNKIPAYMFHQFVKMLKEPLGMPAEDRKDIRKVEEFIQELQLSIEGLDFIHYDAIILALAKRLLLKQHEESDIINISTEDFERPFCRLKRNIRQKILAKKFGLCVPKFNQMKKHISQNCEEDRNNVVHSFSKNATFFPDP